MKSYIRVYGPPLLAAIRALEKVAVAMPKVCIMDTMIDSTLPSMNTQKGVVDYFAVAGVGLSKERCGTIISKSGERMGEYDFFFEWFKNPTIDEIKELIEKVDATLAPVGVRYSISTK